MALEENEIRLNNVRLAFPKIWTAEPYPGGKDPTPYFSAMFILGPDHPQVKELEAQMVKLADAKWGKRGAAVLKAAKAMGKVFFRNGDSKAEYEGFEGNWFVSARSKTRPTILDGMRNAITEADGIILGGYYVNAVIGTYAYVKGNNGLGASLSGIQFRAKGDTFGGGSPADADDFDEIAVEEGGEQDDLTK
jgi:hypothetical protein